MSVWGSTTPQILQDSILQDFTPDPAMSSDSGGLSVPPRSEINSLIALCRGTLMWLARVTRNMDADTERTAVRTYVPAYQKERWATHAEELDMSQSEFVRTMVQAGRREFDLERPGINDGEESPEQPSNPRGGGLEDRVETVLSTEGVVSWDELLEVVSDDLEGRLESALETLQDENAVRYRPRQGGYALVDDE